MFFLSKKKCFFCSIVFSFFSKQKNKENVLFVRVFYVSFLFFPKKNLDLDKTKNQKKVDPQICVPTNIKIYHY